MRLCTQTLKCLFRVKNINDNTKVLHKFIFCCTKPYSEQKFKKVLRKPTITTPRTMKINSEEFKSCITEEVILLKDLFASIGHEIRIVGGAVRDLLMGIQPKDLDFSTTATPSEMKKMFEENNIRMLNVNGEKHGTITSRINDKNFEVTTLRIDVATDGRHAEVQFTKDWVLDANRRDLTINAMYLGLDGTLYDYFNGYEDLKNRRIVFVGDAAARIQEDYLRILRYFRFFGRISEKGNTHDKEVEKAIKENCEGLGKISGERIWVELNKILTGRFSMEITLKMIELGIGKFIGFPNECNENELKSVCERIKMNNVSVQPVTVLVSLFNNEIEWFDFVMRVKPSGAERDLGLFIIEHRKKTFSDTLRPYQILYINEKKPFFVIEFLKYIGKFEFVDELEKWNVPKFPVNGHMLKTKGIKGQSIGTVMNALKEIWFESDFNMSAENLLKEISNEMISTNDQPEKKRRK